MKISQKPLNIADVPAKYPKTVLCQATNHYKDVDEQCNKDRESYFCRYIDSHRCSKFRKSNPADRTCACMISAYGRQPVVICPYMFLQNDVLFNTIKKNYFAQYIGDCEIGWTPEVQVGTTVGGKRLDFVFTAVKDSKIQRIVTVETQSDGTTGSGGLWKCLQDAISFGSVQDGPYPYDMNSLNQFLKTMGQQLLSKLVLTQTTHKEKPELNSKLVFAVQDTARNYMNIVAGDVWIEPNSEDPSIIDFLTFRWVDDRSQQRPKWRMEYVESHGLDKQGVIELLSARGANLGAKDFIAGLERAAKKGKTKILHSPYALSA